MKDAKHNIATTEAVVAETVDKQTSSQNICSNYRVTQIKTSHFQELFENNYFLSAMFRKF